MGIYSRDKIRGVSIDQGQGPETWWGDGKASCCRRHWQRKKTLTHGCLQAVLLVLRDARGQTVQTHCWGSEKNLSGTTDKDRYPFKPLQENKGWGAQKN